MNGKNSISGTRFPGARRLLGATAAASLALIGSVSALAGPASADEPTPEADDTTAPASSSDNGAVPPTTAPESTDPAAATTPADPAEETAEPTEESAETTTAAPSTTEAAKPQKEKAAVAPQAVVPGDFGTGKVRVQVVASGGNSPTGADLSGAEVTLTDVTVPAAPVVVGTCVTGSTGDCGFFFDSFPGFDGQVGSTYTLEQTVASPNFLRDPEVVTFSPEDFECLPFSDCNLAIFEQTGAYRLVGVNKVNSVTGAPLAGATYALCAPVQQVVLPPGDALMAAVEPEPGGSAAAGCPVGTTQASTATTNADGVAIFAGSYPADEGYSVYETVAPAGYTIDPLLQTFVVPAAATLAEVSDPILVNIGDQPNVPAPIAKDDVVTVTAGDEVQINVLANDDGRGAPLQLADFSPSTNGTADRVGTNAILYTPKDGFAGSDTITYNVSTRGGFATAVVRITVVAAATVPPAVPTAVDTSLAYTGVETSGLLSSGLGLVGAGSLLLAAGSLNRRRRLQTAGSHR